MTLVPTSTKVTIPRAQLIGCGFMAYSVVNIGTEVGPGANSGDGVPFSQYRSGTVEIPVGSSITSLTFYTADRESTQDGTYGALQTSTDNATWSAVELSNLEAGNSYPLPDELFGCGAFQMVGNAAGEVILSLKG